MRAFPRALFLSANVLSMSHSSTPAPPIDGRGSSLLILGSSRCLPDSEGVSQRSDSRTVESGSCGLQPELRCVCRRPLIMPAEPQSPRRFIHPAQ
eukprot:1098322-Amphidinium_carterae.1